jgi:hypothetical protein
MVQGTPAASPVAPSVPANSIALAQIAVANGASSIGSGQITDVRGFASAPTTLNAPASNGVTPPIKLTAGTNLATASAGSVEYDGNSFYGTPNATTGRGVLLSWSDYNLATNRSLTTASTSTQSLFGLTTGIALAANTTYEVEMIVAETWTTNSGSAVTQTLSMTYSGSLVATSSVYVVDYASGTGTSGMTGASAVAANSVGTVASGIFSVASANSYNGKITLKGTIRTNAAGNLLPQIAATVNNISAWTILAGSYIKVTPIGATGSTISVGAWS